MKIEKTNEGWKIDRNAQVEITYQGKSLTDSDLAGHSLSSESIERVRKSLQFITNPIMIYHAEQPHGFSNIGLTLREVIERIEDKEFTPNNTLTVRRWAQYVAPNLLERAFLFDKEGFDEKNPKNYETLALQHTLDFPAWGLVEDHYGKLYVCAKGQDKIGIIDHQHYLKTNEIRYVESRTLPLAWGVPQELAWYHTPHHAERPSKEDDLCAALSDITLNKDTSLFLQMHGIQPDSRKSDYDNIPNRNVPRIWTLQEKMDKNIHPLAIGAPTLTMSGGGERRVTMNNIANNRPDDEKLGVIKVSYRRS